MNIFPNLAPRRGPNRTVTSMKLIDRVLGQILFDPKNRRPEDRSRAISCCRPKRGIVEIFSLEDAGEKGIFVRGNVPSRMGDKAFVNSIEVTEPAVLLRLANVFPRTESNSI